VDHRKWLSIICNVSLRNINNVWRFSDNMTDKELIDLLVANNIFNKTRAKLFVEDLRRTADFSKAIRRVYDLAAILKIEHRLEKLQFKKNGTPYLWPSLAVGIEKVEPEPEPPGVRDGRISKILWPSLQPERKEDD